MAFIPVKFRFAYSTTSKFNFRYALEFSPPSAAVLLSDSHDIADFATNGNGLDIFYFTYSFKILNGLYINRALISRARLHKIGLDPLRKLKNIHTISIKYLQFKKETTKTVLISKNTHRKS